MASEQLCPDAASFRDPAGRIFHADGRILRFVHPNVADEARTMLESDFYRTRQGRDIVRTWIANAKNVAATVEGGGNAFDNDGLILEHEAIEPITYPYEWPFSLLKRAAIFHLDLHRDALKAGFDMSDSSAFNVQFAGTRPVFIDFLSFRSYRDGGYWTGYKQFCEQFLGPLVLTSKCSVPFQPWYSGTVNGLDIRDIAKLLPLRSRLSPTLFMHFILHARLMAKITSDTGAGGGREPGKGLKRSTLERMLLSLAGWIGKLRPDFADATYWQDYDSTSSYSEDERTAKRRIIGEAVRSLQPRRVLDLGCNTGAFAEICLEAGAESVVGVDSDHGALEASVKRADDKELNFLPLYQDLTAPSASLGWMGRERPALRSRVKTDMTIALAVLHHLVIGKNIPLEQVVQGFLTDTGFAVIEFVPRNDPMVAGLMRHRDGMFSDYTQDHFEQCVCSNASILSKHVVSASERTIYVLKAN